METAAVLVSQLALTFTGSVYVVADAAYHGPALCTLPANVTWTCRAPADAAAPHQGPAAGHPRQHILPLPPPDGDRHVPLHYQIGKARLADWHG